MANLTITAANVQMTANSSASYGTAGETLVEGQPIYLKSSDQRWWKAEAGDTQEKAEATGIAVTSAVAGGLVGFVSGGPLSVGAILTVKTLYVVSATSGLICPIADLVSGDWVSPLGIPQTTSVLNVLASPQRFQIA